MIELLLQAERAMSVGLVDQAERLYRQAATADPRSSIAVVGLARVALERGDDALAWREGRRALEIDPENAAARRLVDRLEEVWRFRGEAPPAEEPPGGPGPGSAPAEGSIVIEPVADAAGAAPGEGRPESPTADGSIVIERADSGSGDAAAPADRSTTIEPSDDHASGRSRRADDTGAPDDRSTTIEPSDIRPAGRPPAPDASPAPDAPPRRGLIARLLRRDRP